mgnify:CR=1 FL=1
MTEWCGWPVVDEATGWEAAQKILTEAELSDGLPLVPPTLRRLEAMVAGVTGRSDSHGMMPPMFGAVRCSTKPWPKSSLIEIMTSRSVCAK